MENENITNQTSIRIAGVVRESIVDGPGIRFVVFCQGCPHGCKGCHNEETHDFSGGYLCSIDKILEAIDQNPLLDGVTFSGGEPMCQAGAFLELAKEIKKRNLSLIIYTGYIYEDLLLKGETDIYTKQLLELCDYLIDGPYIESQRDLTLQFRGSKNQRIIDTKKSNKDNIVLWQS